MNRPLLFIGGLLGFCISLHRLYADGMPGWGIGIILVLFLLLLIPVIYINFIMWNRNPLEKLLNRRMLKKLEHAIANDRPVSVTYACGLFSLWNNINVMKPGKRRREFHEDMRQLVKFAMQTNDYYHHPAMDSFRWLFGDFLAGVGCHLTNCPQCGKQVHIVFTNAMYNEKVFAVNEDEKTVLTWLEPKDQPDPLPYKYHTDECPYCGNRHCFQLFSPKNTIPLFRFLQDFSMILPDGKRISFADEKIEVYNERS